MHSIYTTNIRNLELGVMNILGITALEKDIDLRFFVLESIKDVLSRDNYYNAEKLYVVGQDNTVELGDDVVGVYSVRNIDDDEWEVAPGKIVFKTPHYGEEVKVFGAFVHLDDECEIPVFEYQEKAIIFRAAYLFAATIPQRYSAVIPFLEKQQSGYCRSAASVSTYNNFQKNRNALMKIANKFIFN